MKKNPSKPRHRARRRPIYPVVKADIANPSASAVTARYAYDGFGKEVTVSGVDAEKNTFRFSTKQMDAETGMNYYGYRHYATDTGRWINRDPIAEKGGDNVYAMSGNDVVDRLDFLGNCTLGDTRTVGPASVVCIKCGGIFGVFGTKLCSSVKEVCSYDTLNRTTAWVSYWSSGCGPCK